ncbi:MAG: hypothetical protein ACPGJS_21450, partial [Flammeovirgaceae bacterium]
TVFSNLWIALSAAASTFLAYFIFQQQAIIAPIALLFFATFARYNIIAFTLPDSVTGEKFIFMKQNRLLLKVLFALSSFASLYFAWQLTLAQLILLGHLAILTLWYIFPLPLGFTKIKPLRKLPFLKIFLIAYVWACSSYLMPLWPQLSLTSTTALGFLERFLFLFAITIPFDIKDFADDTRLQLKTLPNSIGIPPSKWIAIGALLVCSIIVSYLYSRWISIGFILSYAIAAPFIWYASPQKSDLYFLGWVDGTMIWQMILVYTSNEYLPLIIKSFIS